MNAREILDYYSRSDVQRMLMKAAESREVAGVFRSGEYGQRPNVFAYANDILAQVRTGVVEFHTSVERWENPMTIKPELYASQRSGFDLLIDIDCEDVEHGRIASKVVAWALKKHDIKGFGVKFTGNKGFHIIVPWESLPKEVNFQKTAANFPEIPKKILLYLKEYMRERLEKELLKRFSPEELSVQAGKTLGEIITDEGIDPYKIVEPDPALLSPRHLFRMPYSLHKSTFLVSLPLAEAELEEFEPSNAKPSNVMVGRDFFPQTSGTEADLLVSEALDWHAKKYPKIVEAQKRIRPRSYGRIGEENFPPCMKLILNGVSDGKKRSVFILLNFLSSTGWNQDEIESKILEWNRKNNPPLPETYITTQIKYHRRKGKKILPPNCDNQPYYISMGVCRPDQVCTGGSQAITVKNPVNYPFRLFGKRSIGYKPKRKR